MTDEEWMQQVVALRQQILADTKAAEAGVLREQTAARILAALIEKGRSLQAQHVDDIGPGVVRTVSEAVMLADLLRAELAKVRT